MLSCLVCSFICSFVFVCVFVAFVWLFVCFFVCLVVCLVVWEFVCFFVCLFVCFLFVLEAGVRLRSCRSKVVLGVDFLFVVCWSHCCSFKQILLDC